MRRLTTLLAAALAACALAAAAATAATPKYWYPPATKLGKFEASGRSLLRVNYRVNLEPGSCRLTGRLSVGAGKFGYKSVECSWRRGWRGIWYLNTQTGKVWLRFCQPSGDCEVFGR